MGKRRYFTETTREEKHSVGCLSPELRRALNLEKDMLPIWIYRMRILGYPPAWIREAESSTLSIFDDFGPSSSSSSPAVAAKPPSKLPNRESDLEDGELNDRQKYYRDSLFEFPGFNAPVPKDAKDDWLILGMPPYQKQQQLSEAAKSMNFIEPVPYKRTRKEKQNEDDDNDEDGQNFDEQPSSLLEKVGQQGEKDQEPEEGEISKSPSSLSSVANPPNGSKIPTPPNHCDNVKAIQPSSTRVISVGPPVPSNIKSRLPPLDKWAVGMGELLHFENLANSTGAYQKMRGILEKIRETNSN